MDSFFRISSKPFWMSCVDFAWIAYAWKEWSPADKESPTPMGPAADDERQAGRATGPYCTICSLSIISLAPSKREFFFAVRADLNSPHANWRLSSTSAGICFVITYPVHVRALAFVRIEHWSDSLMTLAIIILLLSPCAWPILCDRGIAILSAPGRRSFSPLNSLNMTSVLSSLCFCIYSLWSWLSGYRAYFSFSGQLSLPIGALSVFRSG